MLEFFKQGWKFFNEPTFGAFQCMRYTDIPGEKGHFVAEAFDWKCF